MAKLIQVIETTVTKGTGKDNDPLCLVVQYWSVEGLLLAERDEGIKHALHSSERCGCFSHQVQEADDGRR